MKPTISDRTTTLGTTTLATTNLGSATLGACNYPIRQLPHRTTYPKPITHQDNYLPRTITPVGQLRLRAIPPIARTTTPKGNYPRRKVIRPSLTGNRGEYFRVVGNLEMVEKRGRYLKFATNFKVYQASVRSVIS